MSSAIRSKIRCPNCRKDGKVRAELLNRRVSCKQCQHIFRALAVGDSTAVRATPTRVKTGSKSESTRSPSSDRIVSLEREVRQLRDDLSSSLALAGQVELLRGLLARSTAELNGAIKALEALRLERDQAVFHRDRLLQGVEKMRSKPEITMIPDGWTQPGPAVEADALDVATKLDNPTIKPQASDEASGDPTLFEARLHPHERTSWPSDEISDAEVRRLG